MQERVQMNIRISKDLRDWAKKSAESNHRSLSNFITVVLKDCKQQEAKQEIRKKI